MQDFRYVAPNSVDEAIQLLTENGHVVRVLAGGTDLINQMKEKTRNVDVIVDVKRIPDLNELSYDPENGLVIGAVVPCLHVTDFIRDTYPGLVDGISIIGGSQIQGRATIGGNLGNASPAADAVPPLIVHEATCAIAGPNGTRTIAVEDFCTGPGQTVLEKGELLTQIHVKPSPSNFGAFYLRFIPRNEMDIAVVGAGASLILDGDTIKSARIALGAVAPTAVLAQNAMDYLTGKTISTDVIEEAAKLSAENANPISDVRGTVAQRIHLTNVLTRRALEGAIERARSN